MGTPQQTIGALEYMFENREKTGIQWMQLNETAVSVVRPILNMGGALSVVLIDNAVL